MARDDELIARLAEIRRARDDAWSPALPARTNELAELVERVRGQRIGAEPLYEFLDTTVALTEPSAPGATKAIARLIQLLDWSNDDTRAEALALLETDLTAFRYAAQLWELENRDLPTLHAVPATVERSMAAFLESLARLEHRLAALEHLASHIAWLDRICQVLESERISARAEFSNRLWRRRLWILRKRALRLGLGGLTPSLTQVVLEDEDRSS